jgi:hypothetical protein
VVEVYIEPTRLKDMTGRRGETAGAFSMNDERDDGMRTSYEYSRHYNVAIHIPPRTLSQPHMAQHRHPDNYSQLTTGESSKEPFGCPLFSTGVQLWPDPDAGRENGEFCCVDAVAFSRT